MSGNPYDAAGPDRGLDPALDPDRFDADLFDGTADAQRSVSPEEPPRALDPALDPDRYANAPDSTDGKDLTELIGKARSFEEERNPYLFLYGLAMVIGFLALVSLIFANLSPR